MGNGSPERKQQSVAAARDTSRLRLDVLDGLRGFSALYVALFHAMNYAGYTTTPRTDLSVPMQLIAAALDYGAYAVPIFIVLSGFCLMLPLAQRDTAYIPGGIISYLRRRAWRILPSYYAALVLFLVLIALAPALQTQHNTAWDTKIPVTIGAVISHLLLIHNLNPDWIYKIDGPMWSIAIEWQIYFLFPALLLPIVRRSNIVMAIGLAMVLGVLARFVLPNTASFDAMRPWFLGLFAMGMAGAMIVFSNDPAVAAYRTKIAWGWLNGVNTVALVSLLVLQKDWMGWHLYISEPWVAFTVMGWLIQYASATRHGGRRSWSHHLLESRALVALGGFSYSIYLIHNPIQGLINLETLDIPMSADARLAMMLGLATPLALLCSYAFYVLVERRCIRMKERSVPAARAASAPAVSHASLVGAQEKP
jgi:peptidoglycan/LPS O-acetylase OafA/YrhL